jgi:hypothetical protein
MSDATKPQVPTNPRSRTRRQTAKLLLAAVASLSASLGIEDAEAAGANSGDANQGAGQPHHTQPQGTHSRKKLPGRMKSGTLT